MVNRVGCLMLIFQRQCRYGGMTRLWFDHGTGWLRRLRSRKTRVDGSPTYILLLPRIETEIGIKKGAASQVLESSVGDRR